MKRKILYEGKYLRLVTKGSWEYIERITGDGIVVMVPLTREKRVILIDQFRVAVGRRVVEFPAGLVNDLPRKEKESLEDAARRELLEETGYEAKKMDFLLQGPHAAGGSSSQLTFFLATGLVKKAEGGGDETEEIQVHEIPLTRVDGWLKQMERKGFLVDPKVYVGLYFVK